MLGEYTKPLRIIDLHEREARVFPRNELYDSSGQSMVLPETRALSAIDLRDIVDGVELRALGLIGYLPLTKNISLNLSPKFPFKNLWQMLAVADENYDRVLPILRTYESSDSIAPSQLLARGFCYYLKEILTIGVARGYYQVPHQGHYKPKVNFGRTVSTYLSRGDNVKTISDSFTFSNNVYTNGLLKSACLSILKVIPRSSKWQPERRLIMEALNALHSVTPRQMHQGGQEQAKSLPIWLRDGYLGALTVYSLFLGFTNIGFPYTSTGSTMPSFLFSLDAIFESYIRNFFRIALGQQKIAVLDGNSPKNQSPLFTDNKRFPIKPDLVFKQSKGVLGVGEVKYKPKIDEGDRYQVISHVVALGSPLGIWISPAVNGDAGLDYIGSIATGARFYHYKLDITGDLELSSLSMVKEISALLL